MQVNARHPQNLNIQLSKVTTPETNSQSPKLQGYQVPGHLLSSSFNYLTLIQLNPELHGALKTVKNEIIKGGNQDIAIVADQDPDGEHSSLVLANMLYQLGKNVTIYVVDSKHADNDKDQLQKRINKITNSFESKENKENKGSITVKAVNEYQASKKHDLAISLDLGDSTRIEAYGFETPFRQATTTINIDHHEQGENSGLTSGFADINCVDFKDNENIPKAPATSMVLHKLGQVLNEDKNRVNLKNSALIKDALASVIYDTNGTRFLNDFNAYTHTFLQECQTEHKININKEINNIYKINVDEGDDVEIKQNRLDYVNKTFANKEFYTLSDTNGNGKEIVVAVVTTSLDDIKKFNLKDKSGAPGHPDIEANCFYTERSSDGQGEHILMHIKEQAPKDGKPDFKVSFRGQPEGDRNYVADLNVVCGSDWLDKLPVASQQSKDKMSNPLYKALYKAGQVDYVQFYNVKDYLMPERISGGGHKGASSVKLKKENVNDTVHTMKDKLLKHLQNYAQLGLLKAFQ